MFWFFVLAIFGGLGYYMYNLKKQEEMNATEDWGDKPQGQLRYLRIGRKWREVNSSGTLVAGAQGKRDIFVEYIKNKLKEVEVPDIKVDERLVFFGDSILWKQLSGGERKMLVVQSKKFIGYYLLVHASDYGRQLDVNWYLVLRENWLTRLLRYTELHWGVMVALFPVVILAKIFYAAAHTTIPELMTIFDSEELSCFCTTVHHAAQEAVTALVHDLKLNSAKVNWQTRGFLSIA